MSEPAMTIAQFVAGLRALAEDKKMVWEIARREVEDQLIMMRDSHMTMGIGRSNGLVIKGRDGTPASNILFGPEVAITIALNALADHLEESDKDRRPRKGAYLEIQAQCHSESCTAHGHSAGVWRRSARLHLDLTNLDKAIAEGKRLLQLHASHYPDSAPYRLALVELDNNSREHVTVYETTDW